MSEARNPSDTASGGACRVEVRDGIGYITLVQAARRNPINVALLRELIDAFARLESDQACRVIILTGEGPAFCGGADLDSLFAEDAEPEWQYQVVRDSNRLIRNLRACELPVIAAVNGVAVGGGASLALACDIAIASTQASLLLAFGRIGATAADMGCTYLLARHVGAMRARYLALTGATIDARRGKELGLFADVVSGQDLPAAAEAIARQIIEAQPRRAAALTKLALVRGETGSLDTLLDYEAYAQSYLFRREEHTQSLRAFWGGRRRK